MRGGERRAGAFRSQRRDVSRPPCRTAAAPVAAPLAPVPPRGTAPRENPAATATAARDPRAGGAGAMETTAARSGRGLPSLGKNAPDLPDLGKRENGDLPTFGKNGGNLPGLGKTQNDGLPTIGNPRGFLPMVGKRGSAPGSGGNRPRPPAARTACAAPPAGWVRPTAQAPPPGGVPKDAQRGATENRPGAILSGRGRASGFPARPSEDSARQPPGVRRRVGAGGSGVPSAATGRPRPRLPRKPPPGAFPKGCARGRRNKAGMLGRPKGRRQTFPWWTRGKGPRVEKFAECSPLLVSPQRVPPRTVPQKEGGVAGGCGGRLGGNRDARRSPLPPKAPPIGGERCRNAAFEGGNGTTRNPCGAPARSGEKI
jgi:hypothetical protein